MPITLRAPHTKRSLLALAAAIALAGLAAILFAQPKLTISLNTYALEGRDVFLVPATNRVNLIPIIEGIRARDLPKAWMRLSVRPTLLVSGSQGWERTDAPGVLVYKSAPLQITRFTRADQPTKSGEGAEFPAFAFLPPPKKMEGVTITAGIGERQLAYALVGIIADPTAIRGAHVKGSDAANLMTPQPASPPARPWDK